jgi:hypothetical protein
MLFHTELLVLDPSSGCWLPSEAEDCSLEDIGRDVFPVSLSLLEDLKDWRQSIIILEFRIESLLTETGHFQDVD